MVSRRFIELIVFLTLAVILSACTASGADCETDHDCPSGYFCASGGGILFGGGVCLSKDDDLLDATDLFDVHELHDVTPAHDTSSKTDSDLNSDTDTTDTEEEKDSTSDHACVLDTDCDPPQEGAWSTCEGFADLCATNGIQTRQTRSSTCVNGFCAAKTITQQRDCTRETAGNSCGIATETDFGECSFEGVKAREVSTPTCQETVCETIKTTETLPCICATDDSCGEVTYGNWTACSFESTCASSGKRTREVKIPTCTDSSCSILTTTQTDTCTRPSTTGNSCGTPSTDAWSACTNTNSNTCALTGTRTRNTHTPTCQNDACNVVTTTATESCSLTPPTACGDVSYTDWSSCSFPSTCATTGTQTRTKTAPTCQSGTCNNLKTTETQSCTRASTAGNSCGTPSTDAWSACTNTNSNICALTGKRTQNTHTPTCQNDTCKITTTTTTDNNCTLSPPASCGDITFDAWSECTFASSCHSSGTRKRNKYSPTCQSGTCSSVKTAETQSCTREQPTACGQITYSPWSACAYPANNNVCATSGTRTRTKTTPRCDGNSCDAFKITESETCGTRVTDKMECGLPSNPAWGACNYVRDCQNHGSRTRTIVTPVCLSGTCSTSKSTTQTDTTGCERNTDGNSCTGPGPGGNMAFGTCTNECCDVRCRPEDVSCLQCAVF